MILEKKIYGFINMSSNINHNNNSDPYINCVIFSKYLVLKKI